MHNPFQNFFALSNELLFIRNLEGYLVDGSCQWEKKLGWSIAELQKTEWSTLVHPNDRDTILDLYDSYIQSKSSEQFGLTYRFLHKNKSYRWLSTQLNFDPTDNLIYGVATDISDRMWSGNTIYQENVNAAIRLRDQAIAASDVGIVIADTQLPDMPLIYINPAFEKMTGYSRTEILGVNCRFLQGEDNKQPELDQLREAIAAGEACKVILRNYRKDGTLFWNELAISPIYDEEGMLTNFIGVQADVTERVMAAKDIRLRDQAIAASSVGIVIADFQLPDRPLIYVNKAFEEITGYDRSEVIGKNCRFLQGEDHDQPELQKLKKAIAAGEACKVILRNYRKDGRLFWNELEISPVRNENDQISHYIGVQSDVTERIATERSLQLEKENSEKLLLNILPASIVETLKQSQNKRIAQQFDAVTILFADIVGFTRLSARLEPLELIDLLNNIFLGFDRLVDKYQIEKIKTIGDSYMAVSGVPLVQADHAERMADLALDMMSFIEKSNASKKRNLRIRIGMHSGSVVAGVIGSKKFSYDLWGDAVNIASRMESQGTPGKIQVSNTTRGLLKQKFVLSERGVLDVKGRGEMKTYFLEKQKKVSKK